jgi:membrane protein implicated in regulation of membrane protease activity
VFAHHKHAVLSATELFDSHFVFILFVAHAAPASALPLWQLAHKTWGAQATMLALCAALDDD